MRSIGDNAFEGCSFLASIQIPGSVASIGEFAFQDCSSLAYIDILDSQTSIGWDAFLGCSKLYFISANEDNPRYKKLSGLLCDVKENSVVLCPRNASEVIIPDGIASIREGAFTDCASLNSILIPDSVTSIGWKAFRGCSPINSHDSDSVAWVHAFDRCPSLAYIYYEGTPEQWDSFAGKEEPKKNVTIYFYFETKPTTDGNYWHYADGVPTVWDN